MGGKNCRGGACPAPRRAAPAPAPAPVPQPQQMPQPAIVPELINPTQAVPQPQKGFLQDIKEGAMGTPAQTLRFPNFTPEQEAVLNQLLQRGSQGINNLPMDFGPIEDQARRDFTQKTIPSIAERFSALGAQRSSAFPQLLSQAGSNLETDLAALRSGHSMDMQRILLSLLGMGLTPRFESAYQPRQPGGIETVLSSLAQGAGQGAAGGAGAVMGGLASLAGLAGQGASSLYNKYDAWKNPTQFSNSALFRT